ncbi:NCS1 nucleoside transporter protein [Rutstroemia sp. NJR-2017a WRK4]|nr:NCS1 nucleoside transporter protein [Rutstroemia sp. NJR-2017a WRK4]
MTVFQRVRNTLRNPHLEARRTEVVRSSDRWLDNDDIRPLKLADRTWDVWTYLTFWFSATSTVSTWYAASSAQALGLSMWESIACASAGQCLVAVIIVLNGRAGAKYHMCVPLHLVIRLHVLIRNSGYPILNRAAFGVFGAWWPTFNRAVMAIVWNGVNAVQGGECFYVMLHTLSPNVASFKNIMGRGSALDSGGMLGLGIFWLLTCCFLIIPVPRMKVLVYIKLAVFIMSAIAMCGWTLSMAGGIGPVARQPGTAKGSERAWLLVRFTFLGAANCATFASNAADFQRYACKPNDVILGNLLGFPISNLIVAIIGNLVSSSSQVLFGEVIWSPLTYLDRILMRSYNAPSRAVPKYVSIRTGFFICAVLSIAIQPWYLLKSATTFISFLASYQIFLSSITGVLLCHYYIICRGCLVIPDLYTSDRDGSYWYWRGWNWRAYVAYTIGIVPNFWGFLNNLGVQAPIAIERLYYFAYVIGIVISGGVYWTLCWYWPVSVQFSLATWMETSDYVREDEREYRDVVAASDDIGAGRDDPELGEIDADMKEEKIMETQQMMVTG